MVINAPVLPPLLDRAAFERLARAGMFGDRRLELRRGKLIDESPQQAPHLRLKTDLSRALWRQIEALGLNLRVDTEGTIDFADDFQPMPDIFLWDPAAAPVDLDGPIPAAAVKLVIEVASATLADDLGDKLLDYARAGLAEYWVVDVKRRIVHRHAEPGPTGFARRDEIALSDGVASWSAPDIAIPAGQF